MAVVAVASPTFQPAMRIVTAITKANPAAVTTSFDHDYITGEIVRFYIPDTFGMRQMNGLSGTITVTASDTFTVDIDTTYFDTFAVPSSNVQYAQVLPIGEVNSQLTAATDNVLPSGNR